MATLRLRFLITTGVLQGCKLCEDHEYQLDKRITKEVAMRNARGEVNRIAARLGETYEMEVL